ncbi:MAG TPA: hypothetical protein VLH10_13650 [Yinghuangia sp.]|nr:hypothetical protein [Yinghuangia sp.]
MNPFEITEDRVRAGLGSTDNNVLVPAAQAVFAAAARAGAAFDGLEGLAVEQAADAGLSALRPLSAEWPQQLDGEGAEFGVVVLELLAEAAEGLSAAGRRTAEPAAVLSLHRAADDARATAEALNALVATAA